MRRAGRLILAAALAAGLSGCAGIQERAPFDRAPAPVPPRPPVAARASAPKAVRVLVPKPVKCVPDDVGPPPAYPDSDTALRQAGGAADRYQLMAAGRILRQERLQKLEEAVRRCRNVGR